MPWEQSQLMQCILYKLEKSVKIQEVKDKKLVSSFDLKSTPILNLNPIQVHVVQYPKDPMLAYARVYIWFLN